MSCHKPGPDLKDVAAGVPAGGASFKTPIGILYPPNLTPDAATGIGAWSDLDFVNAMQRGLSPGGQHFIPAFPYTSYAAMRAQDVLDIKAYLASLTPVVSPRKTADIPLAFVLRRGLGLWKWIGLDTAKWQADAAQSQSWNRGSYLVNAPGHCGECHTPRNFLGGPKPERHLAGGKNPEGKRVPNLTPARLKNWNDAELKEFLLTGLTPDGDAADKTMDEVIRNTTSRLTAADLAAVISYLRSLPPLPDEPR